MTYTVRHQVFVSSTFTDLVAERAEVIQALWELDCIPTGMEAFVASNESQWDVIKRVIDECDYYVLIIGGRYGSVTADGISYTEKEYRYAKKLGLPVLAFVHSDPDQIVAGKTEKDAALSAKLDAFRSEVMATHPVGAWTSPTDLGSIVSRSVVREIKRSPRPGWIRNDGASPVALLEQVNALTEENRGLRDSQALAAPENDIDPSLESGADEVEIFGTRREYYRGSWTKENWSTKVSWDELFRDTGPALINETTEKNLQEVIARFHIYKDTEASITNTPEISLESWNEILIQFRALGLIAPGSKKRGVNDRASYWVITPRGDRYLVSLLARRKQDPAPAVDPSDVSTNSEIV